MSKKNAYIRPRGAIHGESRFIERCAMYLWLNEYRGHVTSVSLEFKQPQYGTIHVDDRNKKPGDNKENFILITKNESSGENIRRFNSCNNPIFPKPENKYVVIPPSLQKPTETTLSSITPIQSKKR